MFTPSYIYFNKERNCYRLRIHDAMPEFGIGSADEIGEYKTIKDASERMTSIYKSTYSSLLEEYKELNNRNKKAMKLLRLYMKKFGDPSEDFVNELSKD